MGASTFEDWIAAKCPLDKWVYRGQAAKYDTILPSALRPANLPFFSNRLFDFDPRIADVLLARSPLSGVSNPYDRVIARQIDLSQEGSQSYLVGSTERTVSWSKFLRALGQHYGFPTFYVDLTLDPWVAAAFATLRVSDDGQSEAVPGVVFRWPACRINRGLLSVDGIEVIDLSGISPFFRRPVVQASVLALPVTLPKFNLEKMDIPGAAQSFPVQPGALSVQEMTALSTCERFELPEPPKSDGAIDDLSWLFPDPIDLGYSYMTLVAFLSLIVHYPDEYHFSFSDTPDAEKRLLRQYKSTVHAARVILERECFRLAPGMTPSEFMRVPLGNAKYTIQYQVENAKVAQAEVDSLANRRLRAKTRRRIARKLLSEWETTETFPLWLLSDRSPLDVRVDYESDAILIYLVPEETDHHNVDWIGLEIDRRHRLCQGIIQRCSKVPAFAVVDRERYASFHEVFPTDPAYEDEILCSVSSQRALLGDTDVLFPSTHEGM